MKIIITGANGFIGSHLMRLFSGGGEHSVCGLVRKTSDLFRLRDRRYHLVIASLEDPLEGLLAGFDAVIHTAALAFDWGDYRDFYRTNVEGTIRLARAASRDRGKEIHPFQFNGGLRFQRQPGNPRRSAVQPVSPSVLSDQSRG